MWCECGRSRTAGYTAAAPDPPRGQWDRNYDFWVCANCLAPSRLVFIGLTGSYAPKRAVALLSVVGQGDGRTILRWATATSGERIVTMQFSAYPRRHPDMHATDQGRNVLLTFWHALDASVDTIRASATPNDPLIEAEKVRATTYAEVLAHLMSPFYDGPQAVLAESMNRWTARQEDRMDAHETPGLAEHHYDPKPPVTSQRPSPGKPVPAVLDEAKQNFIKLQLDTGAFPVEELAKMFQVSEDVIRHNYELASA